MATVNEELLEETIRQQVRWLRKGNATLKEVLELMGQSDQQLKQMIEAGGTENTQERRRAIRLELQTLMDHLHAKINDVLTEDVINTAVAAATLEVATITKTVPKTIAVSLTKPNTTIIRTATQTIPMNGLRLQDWLEQFKLSDLNRAWQTIQSLMVAGETTQDIIEALIGTKRLRYKDGARQMSRYGLGTLVRTATNFAANVGRQSTWEENDDVIKSVRWVSTLDTRTTPICRSRDGMVFPVDSGPRPPAHPNCRSTTVAVTKSWRELGIDSDELDEGTRASMNGQVPASMTYYQWLSKQSAGIQREVLGDTRYDLWKKGGIAPEKFVNDAGKSLTLDQLKSLYPDAFKDAGV